MGLNINDMSVTVGEPQRDYLYFIQLMLPSVVSATPLGTELDKLYADAIASLQTNGLQLDMYNLKAIIPEHKTNMIAQQWAGQTKFYSGTDASSKQNSLEFIKDEHNKVKKLFDRLHQLTGTNKEHAAAYEFMQNVELGVAEVSVTKKTITAYHVMHNVKIEGVNATEPNKEGSGISHVTVSICWDSSEELESFEGKEF